MKKVTDQAFSRYGTVPEGYDFASLIETLESSTPRPKEGTVYVPSDESLESLEVFRRLQGGFFGGMPIQIGYCNGHNKTLNCLEYHRGSELNIAADDIVLLVAPLQSIADGKLDTALVEAFFVPAGTVVQLYETTLHYAPCTANGKGFRVAIVLPRGTNTAKPDIETRSGEGRLLWARNKWLLAHPDSPEAAQGAFIGLTGENITL